MAVGIAVYSIVPHEAFEERLYHDRRESFTAEWIEMESG